eukprot:PhF_6_TR43582/c0_g1_i3/m.66939
MSAGEYFIEKSSSEEELGLRFRTLNGKIIVRCAPGLAGFRAQVPHEYYVESVNRSPTFSMDDLLHLNKHEQRVTLSVQQPNPPIQEVLRTLSQHIASSVEHCQHARLQEVLDAVGDYILEVLQGSHLA